MTTVNLKLKTQNNPFNLTMEAVKTTMKSALKTLETYGAAAAYAIHR